MATGSISAFNPEATVSIAATTSSLAVALGGAGPSLLVYNSAASTAFLRLGATTSLTAITGDLPVPPAGQLLLNVSPTVTAVAVILQSGSGTVFFTRGAGSVY